MTQSNRSVKERAIFVLLSVAAVATIGCGVAVTLLLPNLLARVSGAHIQILGSSMEPNFQANQVARVEAVSSSDLGRGDVVVYEIEGDAYIKRLVGLPGETVEIRSGQLIIDGRAYDEPYEIVVFPKNCGPFALGKDEYFVLGDNRGLSNDSCNFGPLPGESIVQRVLPSD